MRKRGEGEREGGRERKQTCGTVTHTKGERTHVRQTDTYACIQRRVEQAHERQSIGHLLLRSPERKEEKVHQRQEQEPLPSAVLMLSAEEAKHSPPAPAFQRMVRKGGLGADCQQAHIQVTADQ